MHSLTFPSCPGALQVVTIGKQHFAATCSTNSCVVSHVASLFAAEAEINVGLLWQMELHHGEGAHQLAAAAEHQSACGQVPGWL